MDEEEEKGEIAQEDAWTVVSAYFKEKGLVRQQLDSYNQFLEVTLQQIVAAHTIELFPQEQYKPGTRPDKTKEVRLPQAFIHAHLFSTTPLHSPNSSYLVLGSWRKTVSLVSCSRTRRAFAT